MRVLSVDDRRRVTFQEAVPSDAAAADGSEATPPADTVWPNVSCDRASSQFMQRNHEPIVHVHRAQDASADASRPAQGLNIARPLQGLMLLCHMQEQIMVELDPEIGALLLPGMTVTGHFFALSDGSWSVSWFLMPSAIVFP